ncbi:MAG: TIGR01906 family membrane protein [Anaerolineae bacterium]
MVAAFRFALAAIFICALCVFLPLTNLYILLSPVFLRYEYSVLPPALSLSPGERLALAERCAFYLHSSSGIELLAETRDNNGNPIFTWRELAHMEDVKVLFRKALLVHALSGIAAFLAGSVLGLNGETRKRIPFYISISCALLAAGLIIIGTLIFLDFDFLFASFHCLFFEGDSWLFAYTDTLIQLFPLRFWVDSAMAWAFLTLGETVALGLGALAWRRAAGG